jgi:protease I
MVASLDGRHILMVIAPANFRDEELLEPKAVFEAHGAVVEIASTTTGIARGMLGAQVKPDLTIAAADPHRYGAIVLVGGSGAPTYLWEYGRLHSLLRLERDDGTPIGAICLAPAALARAGLLRGKVRATVYGDPRAKHELLRGGALYVEEDVVVDGGIVTAAGPHAARPFAEAVVRSILEPPAPSARRAGRRRGRRSLVGAGSE